MVSIGALLETLLPVLANDERLPCIGIVKILPMIGIVQVTLLITTKLIEQETVCNTGSSQCAVDAHGICNAFDFNPNPPPSAPFSSTLPPSSGIFPSPYRHPATPSPFSPACAATKQPSLGTALLAPHGDGPIKGGLNKACLTPTWFAIRGQRASLPSGKKNERKKKTANLEVAC